MASPCSSLHARGLCNSVFGDSWAEVAAALGRSPCGGNEPPRCRAWQVLNRRIVWDVCRVACKTTWDCDANGGAATSAPVGGGADTTVVHLAFAADAALLPAVGASITSAVASSRSSTRLHVHLMTTTASLPAAHALRRCLAASLAQHPRLAGGRLRLTVVDFETAAVRRGLARLLPSDENHQTAAAVEAQPSRRQALKSVRPYARRQALKSVLYARNLKARENFVRVYLALSWLPGGPSASLLSSCCRSASTSPTCCRRWSARCGLTLTQSCAATSPTSSPERAPPRGTSRSLEIARDHLRSPETALKAPPRGTSRSQSSPWRCATQRVRRHGDSTRPSTTPSAKPPPPARPPGPWALCSARRCGSACSTQAAPLMPASPSSAFGPPAETNHALMSSN